MSVVAIKIGGRDYQVACDNGQEDHLRLLADEVDDRVRSLLFRMKSHPGEAMALLLASLMMADELVENNKKFDEERRQFLAVQSELNGTNGERMADIEGAMAATLDDIAQRIERIADQIEIR